MSTDLSIIRFGPWGEPTYDLATGASLRYRVARLADVTDGLSQTLLMAERPGGRTCTAVAKLPTRTPTGGTAWTNTRPPGV